MILYRCKLTCLTIACATILAGCATPYQLKVPPSLDLRKTPENQSQDTGESASENGPAKKTLRETETPHIDVTGPTSAGTKLPDEMPVLGSTPVSVNVQDVPIPVFINEIFGNLLDLNMTLAPDVSKLQELVTLRTEAKQKPKDLFVIAKQLLTEYGIAVTVEGKLVKFSVSPKGSSLEPPLVVSGRALPSVPISHRPIFQLIELDVISSGDAIRWLNTLFGQDIKVIDESGRNSIILSGKPAQVQQALDALRVFDQPLMRGRISTRIEPAFMSAEQLADRLSEVLRVQGYSANRGANTPSSVILLPIPSVNSVLIFASNKKTLDFAVSWSRELDKPSQQAGAQSLFYYQVKNTKATDVVNALSGGQGAAQNSTSDSKPPSPPAASRGATDVQGGSLRIDEPRNAIIYQGEPAQWERMLTLIRQMDKAPRQVLIEVTIAEVTLNDDKDFGLSWFAKNGFGRFDGSTWIGKGSGGASPGGGGNGLTYLLDIAGQNRAALSAFAKNDRVSILSTPRLLVKSGGKANFDVGTEIPTVTMSTTSNQQSQGNTNLLQSIQYRKTGIVLEIEPTVYSDDRVDLTITQEVSEAMPLADNATANSPSIFNRALTTSLSLRDGGSIVLGGLMSERRTDSDSGVPYVKDIPILGNLFKSKGIKKSKTELVIMIIPYIIENEDRATAISQAIIDQTQFIDIEQFPKNNRSTNNVNESKTPISIKK